MFYLKKFFFVLLKFPIRGGLFFFFTAFFILSIHHYAFFQQRIERHFEDSIPTLYFWALVDGSPNLNEIKEKLEKLPGIRKIILKSESNARKSIEAGLRDLDIDLPQFYLQKNFGGLKIILENDLEARSQKLIRGYIIRIFGHENVTLGPIKLIAPAVSEKRLISAKFFREWSYFFLMSLIFLGWVISFLAIYPLFGKISFVVENFQRRTNVKFKILALGFSFMISLMTMISLYMGNFSILGAIILVIVFSLFSFINFKNNYE